MNVRLVIADDHAILISGIKLMLKGSEFEVIACADNGAAVLELLHRGPDILLLDVSMPGLTGLEVLRRVRGEGKKVKVVLLTGSMQVQEAIEALSLAVDGLLLKENGHTHLITCLRAVASGRRWIDPVVEEQVRKHKATASENEGSKLTAREESVARLVAEGLPNRTIAEELGISEGTIKVYLSRIYSKLNLSSRTELALLMQSKNSRRGSVVTGLDM